MRIEPIRPVIRNEGERVAALEVRVYQIETALERMSEKVDEMHAILLKAKGVRWAVLAFAGTVGFFVGIVLKYMGKL